MDTDKIVAAILAAGLIEKSGVKYPATAVSVYRDLLAELQRSEPKWTPPPVIFSSPNDNYPEFDPLDR